MKRLPVLIICIILTAAFFAGCVNTEDNGTPTPSPTPVVRHQKDIKPDIENTTENKTDEIPAVKSTAPEETADIPGPHDDSFTPDGKGVIYFTVMVHLEGWSDTNEGAFNRHAQEVRNTADLFEKYGAKLTLESKEFTEGCALYENVLKEMQDRGHGIGLHADVGGDKKTTFEEMNASLAEMKAGLESLGVTVRHVSGVCSDKDWVTACINNGFEAVTGAVSYGLWALDKDLRPEGFEPYKNPQQGHAAYPWDTQGSLYPWRAEEGADWIYHHDEGKLIVIPSGISLIHAYEESLDPDSRDNETVFDQNDADTWEEKLKEIVKYTDSGQLCTYYASWSLGSPADLAVLEKWLRMVNVYVKRGQIVWSTVPEMIDLYYEYERR